MSRIIENNCKNNVPVCKINFIMVRNLHQKEKTLYKTGVFVYDIEEYAIWNYMISEGEIKWVF